MSGKLIELYRELYDQGAFFIERLLPFSDAATKCAVVALDEAYAICMDTSRIDTLAEETSLVAHECGHIATGSTHRVCSPYDLIAKHDNKADKWAIKKLVPKDELDEAVENGRTEIWDLAEHFGVTEDLMKKAVCWYAHGSLATELYFE